MTLVLSLFPGIGLLDMAFEEEGFCVVRGPDLLWGGDIRKFHPPAGKFDGVIGGPPCQMFSRLRYLNPKAGDKHGNLIPEFERVGLEAQPRWFLMENVREAPVPRISGYISRPYFVNNVWTGGESSRLRRLTFGTKGGLPLSIEVLALHRHEAAPTVLAGHGPVGRGRGYIKQIPLSEAARLQGLPEDFLADSPFTSHGRRAAIGNGVPLPMGRAIAKAVKAAISTNTRS